MFYVGDLSVQDANLLCARCRSANSILEFGVGASTQIFAQVAPVFAEIVSVETNSSWVVRTKAILDLMNLGRRIKFLTYDEWQYAITSPTGAGPALAHYDMIFDDGVDNLRADFAARSWPFLKVGGCLILHDTRRRQDFLNVTNFSQQHYLEISTIEVNAGSSNLTVMTKKLPEPYVDWNVVENRSPVMYGSGGLEETLTFVRDSMGHP